MFAQDHKSALEWLNLPESFGYVLLIVSFVLLLAPYFNGTDFGVVKIPDFKPGVRKGLMLVGPLAMLLAIGAHLEWISPHQPPSPPSKETTSIPAPALDETIIFARFNHSVCLYKARELAVEGGNDVRLYYDFGMEAVVDRSETYRPEPIQLRIGAKVFLMLPNQSAWAPGEVKELRGDRALVGLRDDAKCAEQLSKRKLWVKQEELVGIAEGG